MGDVIICLFAAAGYNQAAQGALTAGRRLASALGGHLYVITIGSHNPELNVRIAAGADIVLSADQSELIEYQPESTLDALKQLCREFSPRAILFTHDTYSQEIVPRLAHRLGGSPAGDVIELIAQESAIRVRRSVYGGKAVATMELKRSPVVAWLRPGAPEPLVAGASSIATVRQTRLKLNPDDQVCITERKKESTDKARLEDARVIVSGGCGLEGPESFKDLQDLAALLGAEVAASSSACDSGWCPLSWRVGLTGKKVSPQLYLAVAIHGSSRHLAGISEAKVVAAINIDPQAPIFKHCRFGIIEDYRKVLPLLKERLAALK
jgi:electron transfer flavoprotein alpha subunit